MAFKSIAHVHAQHLNLVLAAAVFVGFLFLYHKIYKPASRPKSQYEHIQPLQNLDWEKEEPIRLRPFKPKYYLTMALKNTTFNELVCVDKTYLERIKFRRETMNRFPEETLASLPGSEAMIQELYSWLFSVYLPRRFPTMYTLIAPASSSSKEGRRVYLRNLVMSESIPVEPPSDTIEALRLMSSHVDNDFLFLAPRPVTPTACLPTMPDVKSTDTEDKYHLLAFATCYPSGFSSREKLGLPLNVIHGPVPGYAAKLERSMDRFFAALPTGKIVKRANWNISDEESLFAPAGLHTQASPPAASNPRPDTDEDGGDVARISAPELLEEELRRKREKVDVTKCKLRCERQTLHRLPVTGGLVFGFKTFTYELDEIKAEGSDVAEALAVAIEGQGASVPELTTYKGSAVWGDKVTAFLRGTETAA